jgi:hypothetical protein
MTTTLASLKAVLCGADGTQGILQDSSLYAGITARINLAVSAIAGGIRMPDGGTSPPLPQLYDMQTVTTSTTLPYVALPAAAGHVYQRHVFMVADANGNQIYGPRGGNYYSFALFMRQVGVKDLTQAGTVDLVCAKGDRLFYQGIPTVGQVLTIHFYRAPVDMTLVTDVVDGIPDAFATRLIQHYVCRECFGEGLEDSDRSRKTGYEYHTARFFEAMTDFIDFIGIDAEPEYYGTDDEEYEW